MKRKLLIIFLSIVTVVCLAFGISACGSSDSSVADGGESKASQYTVTYDANGGTFADGKEAYSQIVDRCFT